MISCFLIGEKSCGFTNRIIKKIRQKDDQIHSLEVQLRDVKQSGPIENEGIARIKGEYEALIASKDQELDTWRGKISELNEELFIKNDNLKKTTEMMMQLTMDQQSQAERMRKMKAEYSVFG